MTLQILIAVDGVVLDATDVEAEDLDRETRDLRSSLSAFSHGPVRAEMDRQLQLRDVVASTQFEGGDPSNQAVDLAGKVLGGEISGDEAVAQRIEDLHG